MVEDDFPNLRHGNSGIAYLPSGLQVGHDWVYLPLDDLGAIGGTELSSKRMKYRAWRILSAESSDSPLMV